MPPLRFLVDGSVRDAAHHADEAAVKAARGGGKSGSGGSVHEGHEFVREARHRAANTDAAHVGAAADAGHPTAFGDVAVYHRPPAAEFHQAFRRAVFVGEVALFVIARAVASIVDSFAEK